MKGKFRWKGGQFLNAMTARLLDKWCHNVYIILGSILEVER